MRRLGSHQDRASSALTFVCRHFCPARSSPWIWADSGSSLKVSLLEKLLPTFQPARPHSHSASGNKAGQQGSLLAMLLPSLSLGFCLLWICFTSSGLSQ